MSRSIFGWSYPPGCSGPPEESETPQRKCKHCKAFVGGKPVSKPFEAASQCTGEDSDGLCGGPTGKHKPHKVVYDQGVHFIYTCKRCKKETSFDW